MIEITVKGPVGSGKSMIIEELRAALHKLGRTHVTIDADSATAAGWNQALDNFPDVVVVETRE